MGAGGFVDVETLVIPALPVLDDGARKSGERLFLCTLLGAKAMTTPNGWVYIPQDGKLCYPTTVGAQDVECNIRSI